MLILVPDPAAMLEELHEQRPHDEAIEQRDVTVKKTFLRRSVNRFLHVLCRLSPGSGSLRVWLHRWRGVRIGDNVFIGDDVYIENEYPEAVEIQDGAQITLRTVILAHTRGKGGVVIERNAYLGAGCIITASSNRVLIIGEGSVVTAGSVVSGSIPPYTLFGSEKGKAIATITKPLPLCSEYMEFVRGLRPIGRNIDKSKGPVDISGRN